MPVEGFEKKAICPDCNKRIKLIYRGGKWRWQTHLNKDKDPCRPHKR